MNDGCSAAGTARQLASSPATCREGARSPDSILRMVISEQPTWRARSDWRQVEQTAALPHPVAKCRFSVHTPSSVVCCVDPDKVAYELSTAHCIGFCIGLRIENRSSFPPRAVV